MTRTLPLVCLLATVLAVGCRSADPRPAPAVNDQRPAPDPQMTVRPTEDFQLSGDGSHENWRRTEWVALAKRADSGPDHRTRIKVLYSDTGLYVLFDAADEKLTATMETDFADLWKEDVFEIFLWPETSHPLYFEYEISPLGYELPILVPNFDGEFLGWRPWHYEGDRRTRKATVAIGGPKRSAANVDGWRVEVFIPYKLLTPLQNVPPEPGTRWRANFYRVDHDDARVGWDWARVGPSFHEFRKFGTLVFAGP